MHINKFYKIFVARISNVSVFVYFRLAHNVQNIAHLLVKNNLFLFLLILVLKYYAFFVELLFQLCQFNLIHIFDVIFYTQLHLALCLTRKNNFTFRKKARTATRHVMGRHTTIKTLLEISCHCKRHKGIFRAKSRKLQL